MMIRMIALDVDGTLLTSKGTLTEGTVRAIGAARAKGVRVVLSTGRSAPEAVWLTGLAGCDDRAVCLGGAAIANMADGRHLRRWDIPGELAARVLELIRGHRTRQEAGSLPELFYRADKLSRNCFSCPAEEKCDWPKEKKNLEIRM